jgi:hypothetical protein
MPQRRAERERESDPVRELQGQEQVAHGRSVRDAQQQHHPDAHLGEADEDETEQQRDRRRQAQSLERAAAVAREAHECPDLTGLREMDRAEDSRQPEAHPESDRAQRGDRHHGGASGAGSTNVAAARSS